MPLGNGDEAGWEVLRSKRHALKRSVVLPALPSLLWLLGSEVSFI